MVTADAIWASANLPTLPAVTAELLRLSKDPNCEISAFLSVLRTDAAICARLLKAVNSPLFGGSVPVESIDQAVLRLGISAVTSLTLSCALVDTSGADAALSEHYLELRQRSLVQAATADGVGRRMCWRCEVDLFLVGLLLDVGQLALLRTIPERYVPLLKVAKESSRSLEQFERDVLGITHAELGQRLVESWRLPSQIGTGIKLHHLEVEQVSEAGDLRPIHACIIAAAMGEYFVADPSEQTLGKLRAACRQVMSIDGDDFDQFVDEVRAHVDVAGDILSIDTRTIPSAFEVMEQANQHLADIAIHHQRSERRVMKEISELLERKSSLERQAMHDRLTGAYNRNYFDEILGREIARCVRHQRCIGLIFVDIDDFKSINDVYGHQCGDEVLKTVAQAMSAAIRTSDVLTRFGGDEFVVVSVDIDYDGTGLLAERLRRSVADSRLTHAGTEIPFSVSIGASIGTPAIGDVEFAKRLIEDADRAMYECKRNGRNQSLVRSLKRTHSSADY